MKHCKPNIAVLTSGGIDSAIMLKLALQQGHQVWPIYVKRGFIWERAELFWLKQFLQNVRSIRTGEVTSPVINGRGNRAPTGDDNVVSILKKLTILHDPLQKILKNHWAVTGKNIPDYFSPDLDVEIPLHNLSLLCKTFLFAKENSIQEIWIGTLKGNPFIDSSTHYLNTLSSLLNITLSSSIEIKKPLGQLTKTEVSQLGKGLPLQLCFSCLQPQGLKTCGQCNKCAERIKYESVQKTYFHLHQ